MLYNDLYDYLKGQADFGRDLIPLPELGQKILRFSFVSEAATLLKDVENPRPALSLSDPTPEDLEGQANLMGFLQLPDGEIRENREFRYLVFAPQSLEKSARPLVLLHGLNERSWPKYLPWASHLVSVTGRPVILFPIAFHMNRAPASWSDSRLARSVSKLRKKINPRLVASTLSNAALSARLSLNPRRFFYSGLQTFHDLNFLAREILAGRHPLFLPGTRLDFFTYSIGSFLGEIVLLHNRDGLFDDSKYAAFCGGPVLSLMAPVSKFIMDSEASESLTAFWLEDLESHARGDPALKELLYGTREGEDFRAFLSLETHARYREDKLREIAGRVRALALLQDEVVPSDAVVSTLQGSQKDIPIRVDALDFPYPYRHEDPFPYGPKNAKAIDAAFREVIETLGVFLA
ncbi:MAG: DUF6051 family protein [Deltaproteobacteria bacterium]|jgi:hypothetical protein|nr:DUF6051 family protein [Deltaproteobacteria bacterium]